jgi:hypothetical protein
MPSWTSTADHLLHSVLVCGSGEMPVVHRRLLSAERFKAATGAPVNQPDPVQG